MNTKEYTFQTLFESTLMVDDQEIVLTKIEIPIIQRDYAQGRNNPDVQRIRERFLDTLYQSIINQNHITLDFVYGDVSKDGVLTPLDGQQRLTTLFLYTGILQKKKRKKKVLNMIFFVIFHTLLVSAQEIFVRSWLIMHLIFLKKHFLHKLKINLGILMNGKTILQFKACW